MPSGVRPAHARCSLWDGETGLGCDSGVATMQPAGHRDGDDLAVIDGLLLARFGGVLVEREMGPGAVIVFEVLS